MSLVTIEGTYRDGRIELTECPEGLKDETPVLVTFLPRPGSGAGSTAGSDQGREALRQRAFGWRRASTWEDHPIPAARSFMTDSTAEPRSKVSHRISRRATQRIAELRRENRSKKIRGQVGIRAPLLSAYLCAPLRSSA